MHKLLERQLRKHFPSLEALPPGVRSFLDDIDAAYRANDEDRKLVERSLELTSHELMQRNLALRESEEQYRRMVETANEGIWVLDATDATTFVNERMAQLLGWTPAELKGQSFTSFVDASDRAAAQEALHGNGTNKTPLDLKLRTRDGADLWAILSVTRIRGRNGSNEGALCMLADITGRKRAETELRNAYERLKELDQFRSQFINNAAHELGTPLTPIKLQVHLLRTAFAHNLDPTQVKALEILDRNVERIGQLVQDILDVARIQSGRLNLKFQRVELANPVREASESYQAAAVSKGITLESAIDNGMMAHVDPGRVAQVLYNLLGNSLKFTPRGGKIMVVLRQVGDKAQVAVRDNGHGIKAEDQQRLFQPFSQVHDTMQVSAPGTGLGLFICRGLVEQMGGRIWCESAGRGKGAAFIFEFPLARPPSRRHAPALAAQAE